MGDFTTVEEIREYMLDELKREFHKMVMKEENNFGYIYMLCNDMGFTTGTGFDPANR